jgi:cysteine synthase A
MAPKAVDTILDAIGNTPLVKLQKLAPKGGADIFVKAEYFNPSGSYKDRIAVEMIRTAEKEGKLKPGYTIVEASTGNTGTALSFVGTRLGYNVEIYMPEGMTRERIKIMESYGAKVHEMKIEGLDAKGSVAGAEVEFIPRKKCLDLERSNPKIWWARQFSNPANWRAHLVTGSEILEQMNSKVDAFVASIGVGGTLYGVAKAIKAKVPKCRVIGLEPASARYAISDGITSPPGVSKDISGGIIEEMMESGLIDEVVKVTNEDAIATSDRLVKEEGLFCGISAGANVYHSIKVAEKLGKGKRVATVLPDHRDRYLSEKKYTT